MACVDEEKANLGLSNCNEFPALIMGMIETTDSFAVPAATITSGTAAVLAYIQAALLVVGSGRAWYWPGFSKEPEDAAEEEVYQDSPLKIRQVRKGNQRWRFFVSENLCLHKNMQTHKRTNGRVFLIDVNGKIIGTKKTNGDFAGLSLALLNPEKLKWATGSEVSESPIYVALAASGLEFDKTGHMYDGSSFITELYRIVDVYLTIVGTPTTSSIVVDVKTVCDETGVSGLVVADFLLVDDDDGATHTITTSTPHATIAGRYTLAGTAFEDSTLDLDPPATLSIKAYESTGAVAVTIP